MLRRASKATILAHQPFSTREQKVVVRYLFYQETDPSEIHKLLTAICGTEAPSYKDVRQWIQDIAEGKEEADHCVCSGGRKLSGMQSDAPTDPALVARIEYLLNSDVRINIERLSDLSATLPQPIQTILTNLLGLKRVYEKWVPRIWTPEARQYRVNICKELLEMYHEEGMSMLKRIIVGDASFCFYHAPNGNATIANKKGGKYRPIDEPERLYCAFYYDMNGLLVSETLPYKETPTIQEYIAVLKDYLMPAIQRKRGTSSSSSTSSKPLYLLHTVSAEHNALETQKALREMNIIQLPNAIASPDLEPFEYWFLKHLKKTIDSHNFGSKVELWTAMQKHILTFTDSEYNNSIFKLPERWNICIEKQGLYFL
ncbi:UNVERIFIED_CONTAM: hypothetical protein RMT77_019715 [Armadillidium vulgare]